MPQDTPREETSSEVIARLTEELKQSRLENQVLREKIDQLLKRLFGAQSEKLDPAELQMLLKGIIEPPKSPEPVVAEDPQRSKVPSPPRKASQPRIPANIEVVEEVIVPPEVQARPQDWRCMGEEVTKQLDFEPGRFFQRRIVRRKYVRIDAPHLPPVIAPLQTLQDRCSAAPGLIAAYQDEAGFQIDPKRLMLGIAENALYGAVISAKRGDAQEAESCRRILAKRLPKL